MPATKLPSFSPLILVTNSTGLVVSLALAHPAQLVAVFFHPYPGGVAGSKAICRAAALTRMLPLSPTSTTLGNSWRKVSSLWAAGLGVVKKGWVTGVMCGG